MSRVAASGAFSRKSMNVVRPSAKRTSMNPPPPRLPAYGYVTASANPIATAASIALPPALQHSQPDVGCQGLLRHHHRVPRMHRLRAPTD